jgi:hypothetical protein
MVDGVVVRSDAGAEVTVDNRAKLSGRNRDADSAVST